ncbi:probable methyltransferase PMT28 [Primulina eburnea]|uniref:probable methyltransferase PMT28 n=1 Tax=Primulina eburnea TaxID=1245227 RepID=UPI003C6BDFC4
MAIARFGRQVKRSYQSYGFCVKLSVVVILGMCFVFVWSAFSNFSVTSRRESFDDIVEPVSVSRGKVGNSQINSGPKKSQESDEQRFKSGLDDKDKKNVNGSVVLKPEERPEKVESAGVERIDDGNLKPSKGSGEEKNEENDGSEAKEVAKEEEEDGGNDKEGEELESDGTETEKVEGDPDLVNAENLDQENLDEEIESSVKKKKNKNLGPLFDPKARYTWKLCNTRSKYNYIPCIDIESGTGKIQSYRHHERSCPRSAVMCLVPLPRDGYGEPEHWPESKMKILYKNVAHPKLASYIKSKDWVVEAGEYLTFPLNQSVFKGGIQHYLESIEEMVPDIEWGKNIRIALDIGCQDSSLAASLLEKDVLTLTLGLKDDLVDLTQVALERGFPALISPFASRRLPFPSGVFDTIHCGDCSISWHSNGGKLILEINRILRPGGYFILSTKHSTIEAEEALSTLTSSICWNILADKSDEVSDIGVKIYQKPETNDIYELRRKKVPALCKENENPDATWYVPLKTCLHTIPEGIEQRGTEWPAEWPNRLNVFPEWMNDREKLIADSEHWKAIVNNSYLTGMGIDWSVIRNVMDMKAISGGFAAALSDEKIWVMNVVPVHAPNTLPIIFERGLIGVYHDWCESFGSYPRSYDLLHADHLFSRLKNNRCKQTLTIIVEMDRLLRPSGWVIIRDRVEILNPLEDILRSLHWDIRMTFAQNKEGILCAQKTIWRP